MASQRQHRLGRILDVSGPGTYNEETGEWNNGKDVPLVTDTPVYPFQKTPLEVIKSYAISPSAFKSPSGTSSSSSARRSGITDEDTRDSSPTVTRSNDTAYYEKRSTVAPGKIITLVLSPEKPIVNPILFISDEGDRSHVRIIELSLGDKPMFPGKSANDLYGVNLNGMTISNNNPLKATLQNIDSHYTRNLRVYVAYKK